MQTSAFGEQGREPFLVADCLALCNVYDNMLLNMLPPHAVTNMLERGRLALPLRSRMSRTISSRVVNVIRKMMPPAMMPLTPAGVRWVLSAGEGMVHSELLVTGLTTAHTPANVKAIAGDSNPLQSTASSVQEMLPQAQHVSA